MNTFLEKREDGKYKLIENILIPASDIKPLPLTEESREIVRNGKKYKCIAAYTFPISRPDNENLNGRIYSSALWENVINKKMGNGNFGLCDHPEGDGSVKDAFTVWHNIRFSESRQLIVADAYLFGEWGRHCKEAIDAGGKIGLSSVGYGEFKSDNKTVDESTYELDRPADWVLNPSQEVFGSFEDEISSSILDVSENLEDSKNKLFEKIDTINIENNKQEIEEELMDKANKLSLVEEKNFRLNIKNLIKEADEKENISEKLDSYKEILTYFEEDLAVDLKESILEKITSLESELKELAIKGSTAESLLQEKTSLSEEKTSLEEKVKNLELENSTLKEEYEKAVELLDSMKEFTNKLKDLYEEEKATSNGKILASEYKELLVYSEQIEKELDEEKSKLNSLRKENKILQKELEVLESKKKEQDSTEDEEIVEEEEDEKETKTDKEEKSCKKESEFFSPDIEEYYLDLEEMNPALIKIKDDIAKCRTIAEAQLKYFRLKSLVEDESYYSAERREVERMDENFKTEKYRKSNRKSNRYINEDWF